MQTFAPGAALVILLVLLGNALAEDDATPPKAARGLAALDWMAGRWVLEKGGEVLEETWGAPLGDSLVGMFRWVKNGRCGLYELMSIEEDDGKIVLRLRHFNRGLEPWASEVKAPLTYPLVRQDRGEAVFENPDSKQPRRFVYRREKDGLVVRLEGPDGSGMEFRFTRHG